MAKQNRCRVRFSNDQSSLSRETLVRDTYGHVYGYYHQSNASLNVQMAGWYYRL
jgi:hypothetical protein